MIARSLLGILGAVLLASCGSGEAAPDTVVGRPALWEITSDTGEVEGWLFGTVHALPPELQWRSEEFDRIASAADLLVVEVAGLDDRAAMERQFRALAYDNPPDIPLYARLDPARRDRLREVLAREGASDAAFDSMESWAAALALAEYGRQHSPANGADKVMLGEFASREIFELEGTGPQLRIFDGLPEKEQRDLLAAIIDEISRKEAERADLAEIWASGDLARLERITREGMLADPELREALLDGRNRAWAGQIENLLTAAPRPLIAVGAGHLLGEDGVPALLSARGYELRRVQ